MTRARCCASPTCIRVSIGGQMWIAMDPPTADQQPQEGVINVRDFSIRGESELQRVASNSYNDPRVPRNSSAQA